MKTTKTKPTYDARRSLEVAEAGTVRAELRLCYRNAVMALLTVDGLEDADTLKASTSARTASHWSTPG
jgi:hypothetical protein